jgi:hypothetical protein
MPGLMERKLLYDSAVFWPVTGKTPPAGISLFLFGCYNYFAVLTPVTVIQEIPDFMT